MLCLYAMDVAPPSPHFWRPSPSLSVQPVPRPTPSPCLPPEVHSSRMANRGRWKNRRAIPSRCCSPNDRTSPQFTTHSAPPSLQAPGRMGTQCMSVLCVFEKEGEGGQLACQTGTTRFVQLRRQASCKAASPRGPPRLPVQQVLQVHGAQQLAQLGLRDAPLLCGGQRVDELLLQAALQGGQKGGARACACCAGGAAQLHRCARLAQAPQAHLRDVWPLRHVEDVVAQTALHVVGRTARLVDAAPCQWPQPAQNTVE